MDSDFSAMARRAGLASAASVLVLAGAYALVLVWGLASLSSPDQPIANPMFTIMEVLIILLMPAMVALMAAVHMWAPRSARVLSLIALIFMGLVAGLTSSLHFVILTLSRQAAFADPGWVTLVLSFNWPSIGYALDILAWDVFFSFAMLFAAPVFGGSRLALTIRWTMVASGVLAFVGLGGAFTGNMQLRNIGIVGYLGVYMVVVVLLATLFARARPAAAPTFIKV
jgi:hypothetical protein